MIFRSATRLAGLGAASVLLAVGCVLASEVPYLGARVQDDAGMIPRDARERLEAKLRDHEARTTNQVAVLTVESLGGDPIEEFSMRVAETWKLGRKGRDNGVLFLVARRERKMRIEVGYGLEPVLTDAIGRRILDERVAPRFRAGDFPGGFEAGVDAVLAVLEGREPPATRGGGAGRSRVPAGIFAVAILAVFLTRVLLLAARRSPAGRSFLARHPGLAVLAAPSRRGRGSGLRFRGGGFSGGGGGFGGGGASGGW